MAERDLLYRAKFQDDVTPAHEEMISRASASSGRMGAAERSWNTEIQHVRASILEQRDALVLRKEALDNPATLNAIKESKQLREEIRALTGELKPDHVRSASQTWQEMASAYFLVTQAAQTLGRGMMAVVDAAKEYDSVRVRLTSTEGSSLVADKDLRNLQELAKLPGLGFSQAAQAMASLRALHVSAKDTFGLIEGIARGNASMGGGAEAFSRVMYQITQSIGKSKVDMTDLKPVMEAIPNMGAMIAEKFGSIDSEKINKQLDSMGKTSKDFWMDIADMASKLPPAGETIANNMDNIGDSWTRFKASLANTDVIKSATGALAKFLDELARGNESRTAEKSLRQRAQEELGFGSNLTYHKNLGERDPVIVARMAIIAARDKADTLMAEGESAAKDARLEKEPQEARRRDKRREEAKKRAAHDLASQQNVVTNPDGSVTLRSGIEYESQPDAEHLRNRAKAESTADRKADDEIKRKEKLRKDLDAVDKRIIDQENRVAEAKIKLADKVAEAQRKSAAEQIAAQRQIASEGEKTFAILAGVAENSAGRQSAAYKTLFSVSKGFAIADASIQIADALAKSANMPFPMNLAAYASTAALTAGIVADIQAVTMAGHAKGGTQFGGYAWRHESGPEMAHAVVPTQIMQASHTTNNNGGNTIHVHVHGGDQKAILRTIRNATTNGAAVSH